MDIKIPKHIAIIMDGNGRWAKKKGMPRAFGHQEGVKRVRDILKAAKKLGVSYLSLYAFSTENWSRPEKEVNALLFLFDKYLKKERKELNEENVKLMFSGRRNGIPKKLLEEMDKTYEFLKNNDGITLNIVFNYGGRAEILDAVNKIIEEKKSHINEEDFGKYLYNPNIPDPELLIRTGGEYRVSNFLLWQIAYSEIYIVNKFWPDFKKDDLDAAVREFGLRERRFGGIDVR